jgi:hypothetical protein
VTSDLEQALLSAYPGVSKHLDDRNDDVNSDIFTTQNGMTQSMMSSKTMRIHQMITLMS